ncbi:hypothetical protein KC19_2G071000 [Ceratodon purpureus]|uniref:Protein kinase domain-containing protein n=1 Tax=Ceratodon purpureus TaxID=3225 RepID=A0A8T0ISU1_CERPU|nr:hypothetical protein KC19_2G071000 [Ceratodon purpureus]KAG0586185.1 hypothetical protein KC19_2G071000 [Ceratodon purpureus]KAG0586186.1 hypothetical protein KC19_2G071000 [Ceratodon purpureus]KAG0586187.1 hypothetical protein KC19_2G071000 [Ceratodon purpureus]KAG0586188.1 hypothetical protein KC19_2G071000 [Ceratodon purpureus]
MEHEQRTPHSEPSSSTSAYCSTLEELELDVASSSVYTSDVEGAKEELISSRLWTSIDFTSDSSDIEGYVRVLPEKTVYKYPIDQIKLLEKIGEGGQGTIYTAKIDKRRYGHDDDDDDSVCVVKLYKGRRFGEWPEAAFGLHLAARFICKFYGYCLEGDLFYLVMTKYDCSLRDVLDKQMNQDDSIKGKCPLPDVIALQMIIQIAIGMWFLHDNNVIHRDLKADNIFVETSSSGVPVDAYIGDFDVASYVVGTSFWRAPEVLQALKDGKRPIFTPKSDVYSYAMTCYEILTGGVPLEGVRFSDYDAVLQHGKRPKLPSDLNPKLKDFLGRCWHQDPEARPTSKEIVAQLTELHKELITGSEVVSRHFDEMLLDGRSSLEASPEANLLELKTLLQAILVKYNQPDYLVLLMEVVADIEQYQSTFGLRSMKEHPVLPCYRDSIARLKMFDTLVWKYDVFRRVSKFIIEEFEMSRLCDSIIEAISEGAGPVRPPHPFPVEDVECLTDFLAWMEEREARELLPEQRRLKDFKDLDEDALGLILLNPSEYTSHMRCGRSGQVLSTSDLTLKGHFWVLGGYPELDLSFFCIWAS